MTQPRTMLCMAACALFVGASALGGGPAAAQQTDDLISFRLDYGGDYVTYFFDIDADCRVVRGYNVSVYVLPKNGKVTLSKATVPINQAWIRGYMSRSTIDNVTKCYGRPVPVIQLTYAPNRGYSGFDAFEVALTFPGGRKAVQKFYGAVR